MRIKGWIVTLDNRGKKYLKSSFIRGWCHKKTDYSIAIKLTNYGNYELVDEYNNSLGVSSKLETTTKIAIKYMRSHPREQESERVKPLSPPVK